MTNYIYVPTSSDWSEHDFGRVSAKDVTIEDITITHDDIPLNEATPRKEVKEAFLDAGYTKAVVESMIKGLSELPEYGKNTDKQERREED
ncbi:hypothetical protein A2774_05735 [Candidatus Roizmanbacteria bacterium RIFCSPHIGHO2_01_FULL_39_12c]|uniref:Uncharacterized protein n=1 Tax=Candidatus Roizmanbacteria bacterium RIFCSPHIGHO2_01_FULL_39_12c TaxID=1802031 RepID=A0A1F7G8B1_9BACT|nr:MAG: hypothetical protein A2774_05735 [Candidatus Roizmanbacteria bacterium RIFCSPHIGHO2_01_FULL_39_12c]OGK47702.1 MAG: hypothetical protein A2963_00395 [Candidatus Roizmanbacteria bacterium RIFCSPLOWO2_01_FULL_40_13]